jgi:hypothetical protein
MSTEVKSVGQLINNTNRLVDNMTTRQNTYFDTFVNTEPKDVEVEKYNSDGSTSIIDIPNVAKIKEEFDTYKTNVANNILDIKFENGVLIIGNTVNESINQ